MPDGRDADPARVIDFHPAFGGVVIAMVEDPVPRRAAAGHHGGPGRGRDRGDRRAERPGCGAGEEGVEVGHQAPLPHRVQHAPGRTVQAQDDQSIDGLRHRMGPQQPRGPARGSPRNRARQAAVEWIGDSRSRCGADAVIDVDLEFGRIVVRDLPPFSLGTIELGHQPSQLLAQRQSSPPPRGSQPS